MGGMEEVEAYDEAGGDDQTSSKRDHDGFGLGGEV